jgi:hypothetical protein
MDYEVILITCRFNGPVCFTEGRVSENSGATDKE